MTNEAEKQEMAEEIAKFYYDEGGAWEACEELLRKFIIKKYIPLSQHLITSGYRNINNIKLTAISDEEMKEYCRNRNKNTPTKCSLEESCKACQRQAQRDLTLKELKGE
jgi:hypothetical protein